MVFTTVEFLTPFETHHPAQLRARAHVKVYVKLMYLVHVIKFYPWGQKVFSINKKEIRQSVQQTNFYRVQSFHKIKHLFIHFNALLGNKYFGNQTKSEEDLIPLKKNEKSDFVLQNNNLGKTTLIALVSYLWLICSA